MIGDFAGVCGIAGYSQICVFDDLARGQVIAICARTDKHPLLDCRGRYFIDARQLAERPSLALRMLSEHLDSHECIEAMGL